MLCNTNEKTKKNNFFSKVFSFTRSFLNIKSKRLADFNSNLQKMVEEKTAIYFDRNMVDSWTTRGAPKTDILFGALIQAVRGIIEEDKKVFGNIYKKDVYIDGIKDVLNNFQVENTKGILEELISDDLLDSIIKVLRYAYDNKQVKEKEKEKKYPNDVGKQYSRLVIFDLDGTLIKGIKYSWTLLYQAVGVDTTICNYNKKRFERRQITYPEWCQYDCEELKRAGLTREKAFAATKQNCALTKNFSSAIHMLKDAGFAVAIISGGADPVLYSLIPDADELFDGNILINKLNFGENGALESITPTEYDWDDGLLGVKGKRAGLELFCKKYNIPYDEKTGTYPNCVFVGDDDNDFKAMEAAGLRILYYVGSPDDKTYGVGAGVSGTVRELPSGVRLVEKNDLLVIANLIKEKYNIS